MTTRCNIHRLPAHIFAVDKRDLELLKQRNQLIVDNTALGEEGMVLLGFQGAMLGELHQLMILACHLHQMRILLCQVS